MDILQFFVAYVISFGLLLVMVLLSHASPTFGSLVDTVKKATLKAAMASVPEWLSKAVNKSINYVFYTRNPLLQILSVFFMLLGNAVYLTEVVPVLYAFNQGECHILITPLALLLLTLVPYYLSCVSDPGAITSDSEASILSSVYKTDGVMFKEGQYCRTCKQIKPARSKHCALCGHCIHRFDHHCLWTNNCVGGANLRHFLLFLGTLQVMVAHGAFRGIEALQLIVRHSGTVNETHSSVKWYIIIESLFLQQPGCTLLVTSLLLLFALIGLLTLYHVMLIVNNQTTNERYKITSLSQNRFRGEMSDTLTQGIRENYKHISHQSIFDNCQITRRSKNQTKKLPSMSFSYQTSVGHINNNNNMNNNYNGNTNSHNDRNSNNNGKNNDKKGNNNSSNNNNNGDNNINNRNDISNNKYNDSRNKNSINNNRSNNNNNNSNNNSNNSDTKDNNSMTPIELRGHIDIEQLNVFYDRGLLNNIKEVVYPWLEYRAVKSKLKQKEDEE